MFCWIRLLKCEKLNRVVSMNVCVRCICFFNSFVICFLVYFVPLWYMKCILCMKIDCVLLGIDTFCVAGHSCISVIGVWYLIELEWDFWWWWCWWEWSMTCILMSWRLSKNSSQGLCYVWIMSEFIFWFFFYSIKKGVYFLSLSICINDEKGNFKFISFVIRCHCAWKKDWKILHIFQKYERIYISLNV
jgi:hypothetical protein